MSACSKRPVIIKAGPKTEEPLVLRFELSDASGVLALRCNGNHVVNLVASDGECCGSIEEYLRAYLAAVRGKGGC